MKTDRSTKLKAALMAAIFAAGTGVAGSAIAGPNVGGTPFGMRAETKTGQPYALTGDSGTQSDSDGATRYESRKHRSKSGKASAYHFTKVPAAGDQGNTGS